MPGNTRSPSVVRVSETGEIQLPIEVWEAAGASTPGEVFVYEAGDRLVVEPIPSLEDLHGIHARDRDPGDVGERVREASEAERRRESERAERLDPENDG